MRVQDLDAANSAASTDELIITNQTTHKSERITFANFLSSIASLANLVITTLFQVTGDTQLADTIITGDLEVDGDIYQRGSAYETHAEKVYTKDDVIHLRDGAVAALDLDEYSGVIAKHYDADGNDGALVFNRSGEARVGDYNKTAYIVYSTNGTDFYTDAQMTEPATIPAGITPTATGETNEYTYTVVDDDTEPLLTRDEAANISNGQYLKWDDVNKKAIGGLDIPDPTVNNTVLTAQVTQNGVTAIWKSGGNGSVSRFATMADVQTALAIPEGQDGYIPHNGIVIVDELEPYLEGDVQ